MSVCRVHMQAMRRPILLLQRPGVHQPHHCPALPLARRSLQTSAPRFSVPDTDLEGGPTHHPAATQDGLNGETSAKGRTGGGEPLESSSPNAVPKPKISNLSVPGEDFPDRMTKEQKEEVDQHNRDFDRKHDRKHDRSKPAPNDKVDKKFWSGERH